MSTVEAVMFEFRCTKCWQALYASCEDSGTSMQCKYCLEEITIPEVTTQRVERARNVDPEPQTTVEPAVEPAAGAEGQDDEDVSRWTTADYDQLLKRDMKLDVNDPAMLTAYASPPVKRLVAHIVDSLLMSSSFGVGILLVVIGNATGIIDLKAFDAPGRDFPAAALMRLMIAAFFPSAALTVFQWCMISVEGKTIGKKLLRMKIIRRNGGPPGFLQGVFLRNWLRVLLSCIPFFALVDICFVFTKPVRCLHDYIACTWVIDE